MGCLLDDLGVFGIHPNKWTIAAQDEREGQKTAKQGAEFFMTKWIAAERARAALRHAAIICPNGTGRTKERVAQRKRARTGLLATVDKPRWRGMGNVVAYWLTPSAKSDEKKKKKLTKKVRVSKCGLTALVSLSRRRGSQSNVYLR